LRRLGLETTVQTRSATIMFGPSETGGDGRYAGGRIHNIVARLPGTNHTRPVALVTHYDSTEASPGANDAGVPVSVLLETARALAAGAPRRNDILFVFTDAEESGLLGAEALVADPAVLPRETLVLNFEARGGHGPTLMFETGSDAAWLIDVVAEHTVRPMASSLFAEVYRFLPNLTDFTLLRGAGHAGLNFAYLDGYTHYHGPTDTVDEVDPATVQHQGEYALGLVRGLSARDLTTLPSGAAVYFTIAGRLLSYPAGWAGPLAFGTALLGALMLGVAHRRGMVSLSGVARGKAIMLAYPAVAAGAALAVIPLATAGHPEYMYYGDIADNDLMAIAILLFAVSACGALAFAVRRVVDAPHQQIGALAVWILLACVTAILTPGASFLFTWLALAGVLAAGLYVWQVPRHPVARTMVATALVVAPVAAIVAPLVLLIATALGIGLVAVACALLAMTLAALPVAHWPLRRGAWSAPAVGVAVAVALGNIAFWTGTGIPMRADVSYVLDADTGAATWVSTTDRADDWSGRFLPAAATPTSVADLWPGWTERFRRAEAPPLALPAPRVTMTTTASGTDGRLVRLTVASSRDAHEIGIFVTGAAVRAYDVAGATPPQWSPRDSSPPWELWIRAVPPEGIEILLTLGPGEAMLRVVDRTPGLPSALAPAPPLPGPPAIGARAVSDATFVYATRWLR
jgi:hypothetical protein